MVAPLALVLTLSACDSGSGSSSVSTVVIRVSSYVTNPAVTQTPTTQPGDTLAEGETAAQEQEYEVKAGDYLSRIASRYDVSMEEIISYNKWSDGTNHRLNPGDIVKIPPGAKVPSAEPETTTTTEGDAPPDTEGDGDGSGGSGSDARCPDGSVQPTYVIEAGDTTRAKVADKFDTTVAALDAVNANTTGYGAFYAGLEILVPCKDDSADTTG